MVTTGSIDDSLVHSAGTTARSNFSVRNSTFVSFLMVGVPVRDGGVGGGVFAAAATAVDETLIELAIVVVSEFRGSVMESVFRTSNFMS